MKKRIEAYFEGRVQGVGFRFTAIRIATDLKIYGWVRNLPDGTVAVVAEAEEEDLKDFLSEIKDNFSRYIRDVRVNWLDAANEFQDFGVRF